MTDGALRDELRRICAAIADGRTAPISGASRIWVLLAEADYPPELDDFRAFVGLVSEIQDHPEHRGPYTADIIDVARRVAERTR